MKIIVLSSCYPRPSNPNQCIFIHRQARALVQEGHEVHVIQPVYWYPPWGMHNLHPYWEKGHEQHVNSFDRLEGVKVHHPKIFIKMPTRIFRENGWDREGRQVANYISRNHELRGADIILAQFLIHEGYVGSVIKKRIGIPLACLALGDDVHAWPDKNPVLKEYIGKALRDSDLIFANGRSLAREVEDRYGSVPAVIPIYRGVDLEHFHPIVSSSKEHLLLEWNLDSKNKHVLCVATPVVLKGWIELLDSFSELRDTLSEWKLVMVAPPRSSSDALDLEQECRDRKLEKHVIHLGAVKPQQISSLMQSVDAFVLPSYNEGLSNAVMEALASGLPVITTDVGGHSEVITDHYSGILIKPKNKARLKAALQELLLNDKMRTYIGSNARKAAEKIGSYQKNAQDLIRILSELKREVG